MGQHGELVNRIFLAKLRRGLILTKSKHMKSDLKKTIRHFSIWRPTLKCIMASPAYNGVLGFYVRSFDFYSMHIFSISHLV